tara:strand:- start:375 stop:2936 length:2562 start_codon:yes stop_codon:yes gene_type:complete
MTGYSSRQSTYTTGDTIAAADSNDEFDAIVTAFGTSGHTHDGTSGNGGALSKLAGSNAITIGAATAGTDITVTFDGETNDGVLLWMEDEDYFKFNDDIMVIDNENIIFGTDSNILIGYDETTTDSLRIKAAEGAGLAITLCADEGDDAGDEWKLNIADGGVLTLGNDKNSAGTYVTHMTLTPHATVASSVAAFAGGVTIAGDLTITGDDLTMGTNTSGHIMVADGTNFNPVAVSGDVTMASGGAITIASGAVENAMLADDAVGADELAANAVVNASVASGAAIAFSKMADLTASRALVSDGSGDVSVSSVTSTEVGYLDITTLGTSEASKAVTVDASGDLIVPDSDKYKFGSSSDMQLYHDGTNSYITNSQGALKIATESSGIAVTIGHSTSEVTVADNLTVTGNMTVNGDSVTQNVTNLTVGDALIKLNQTYVGSALDAGFVVTRGDGSSTNTQNVAFIWDESADEFATIKAATENGETAGNVTITDYFPLHVGALTAADASTIATGSTIGNLTLANGSITDSSGAIAFGNENLSTTGNFSGAEVTATTSLLPDASGGADIGTAALEWGDVYIADDKYIQLGSNQDIKIGYDETTTDSLVISSAVNDAALSVILQADAGADAGDEWKLNVANGGTLTLGNDIASAGTHATLLTATPNSTAASSTLAFVGDITSKGNSVKTVGKESIWVPASAMYPSTTNPCADLAQVETTALRPDLKVLDFDPSSDEFAQFTVAFPKSWNEGTVTFQPFWTVTGTDTGTVAWQLGGIAVTSDATINTAFGTLVAPAALAHSGTSNDLMVSVESGAVTIAGSPSTDDVCFFQINRDVSADAQTGDARLIGIKLFFTTDAANDG